jgi:hypothetical protein
MLNVTTSENRRREMAHRSSNGIEVTLLWGPGHDEIVVEVADHAQNIAFELSVDPDQALDAFQHPYAYASRRMISYETSLRAAA